jgi:hypothetical protein
MRASSPSQCIVPDPLQERPSLARSYRSCTASLSCLLCSSFAQICGPDSAALTDVKVCERFCPRALRRSRPRLVQTGNPCRSICLTQHCAMERAVGGGQRPCPAKGTEDSSPGDRGCPAPHGRDAAQPRRSTACRRALCPLSLLHHHVAPIVHRTLTPHTFFTPFTTAPCSRSSLCPSRFSSRSSRAAPTRRSSSFRCVPAHRRARRRTAVSWLMSCHTGHVSPDAEAHSPERRARRPSLPHQEGRPCASA